MVYFFVTKRIISRKRIALSGSGRNDRSRIHRRSKEERPMKQHSLGLISLTLCSLLAACGGGGGDGGTIEKNVKPDFVGTVTKTTYDGTTDDLLTGGLGKSGLQGTAPTFADPSNPTPAELRRYAIYNNYRPLVDITTKGGFGTLYGPNIDASGNVTAGEGKIAGTEYIAYDDDGTGKQNV